MQHTAERNGWTRFITMQPQYNLLYREEEREMLPCVKTGRWVIPESDGTRQAHARLECHVPTNANDAFALKMYENAALLDKPVIDVVASIAEKHAVPRAHVAIAGCYQNPSSQHRSLAQRNQNIFPRLSARWTFHLAMPKSRNWKFAICRTPLTGSFPASGYAAFPRRLQRSRTINTLPRPGVAGSPRPLIPGH